MAAGTVSNRLGQVVGRGGECDLSERKRGADAVSGWSSLTANCLTSTIMPRNIPMRAPIRKNINVASLRVFPRHWAGINSMAHT